MGHSPEGCRHRGLCQCNSCQGTRPAGWDEGKEQRWKIQNPARGTSRLHPFQRKPWPSWRSSCALRHPALLHPAQGGLCPDPDQALLMLLTHQFNREGPWQWQTLNPGVQPPLPQSLHVPRALPSLLSSFWNPPAQGLMRHLSPPAIPVPTIPMSTRPV